jgi:hypothetical protein
VGNREKKKKIPMTDQCREIQNKVLEEEVVGVYKEKRKFTIITKFAELFSEILVPLMFPLCLYVFN